MPPSQARTADAAAPIPAADRPGPRAALRDELTWVADVLWPPASGAAVRSTPPPPDERPLGCFGVYPRPTRPRLLLPLDSRRGSAEALRRYSSSRPLVTVTTRALRLAASAGLLRRTWPNRVYVSLPRDGEPRLPLVESHLRGVLGWPELEVAVLFSPGRPQKKPVLQLILDGVTRAYAKVGWNELTRALVRTESRVLASLHAESPPSSFRVPRMLYTGGCGELELVVVEAPAGRPWYDPRRRAPRSLPVDATRELASLAPTRRRPLAQSGFLAGRRREVEELAPGRDALPCSLLDLIETEGAGSELDFGFAHGDWVPWNMARTRGGLVVWDWERAEPSAPVGLDAVHFLFQLHLNFRKRSPADAVDGTLRGARHLLPRLGVDARTAPLLLLLHLLQMTIRLEQGRDGGIGGVIPSERYRRSVDAFEQRARRR